MHEFGRDESAWIPGESSGLITAGDAGQLQGWRLTPIQRSMLVRWLRSPRSGHYIQQLVWRGAGALDAHLVEAAWARMIERHEALRLYFAWEGSLEPRQFLAEPFKAPVAVLGDRAAGDDGVADLE